MLADWYFCTCRRARPKEVAAYLQCVEVLDNRHFDARAFAATMEVLSQPDKDAFAIHALPRLLRIVGRKALDESSLRSTDAVFSSVVSLAQEDSSQQGLEAAFRSLTAGNGAFAAALAAIRVPVPRNLSPAPAPYADITSHVDATCYLALLNELAKRELPSAEQLCDDEAVAALVHRARQGVHGRQALLIAIDLLDVLETESIDALADDLRAEGDGSCDLEPDLVGAIAKLTIRDWRLEFGSAEAADRVCVETTVGALWDQWRRSDRPWAGTRRDAVLARLVGDQRNQQTETSAAAVIWHHAWWWEATRQMPKLASRMLADWWEPPTEFKEPGTNPVIAVEGIDAETPVRSNLLTALGNMRDKPTGEVTVVSGDSDWELNATLVSPWLKRGDNLYQPSGSLGAVAGAYGRPEKQLPLTALRTLAAAFTAVRLLHSETAEDRDVWIDFVLHANDVILHSCLRKTQHCLRMDDYSKPLKLPLPLQGLLLYVGGTVDRIGRGADEAVAPKDLVDHLNERFRSEKHPERPRGELYTRSVKHMALQWVRLAKGGGLGPYRVDLGQRWFDDHDGDSPADLVVNDIREDDLLWHRGDYQDKADERVVERSRRALHEELAGIESPGDRREERDWLGRIDELVRMEREADETEGFPILERKNLLVAPEYSLGDWEEKITPHVEEWSGSHAWQEGGGAFALVTVRAKAVLRHLEATGDLVDPEWIDEWCEKIAAVSGPYECSHLVRKYLIDQLLTKTWPSDPNAQSKIRAVTDAVVDTVLEFSRDAVRFYDELFTTLTGRSFKEGRDDSELDRVYSRAARNFIVLHMEEREVHPDQGPYELVQARASRAAAWSVFEWFVGGIADRPLDRGITLGAEIAEHFEATRPTQAVAVAEATDDVGDALLTLAAFTDHYNGGDFVIMRKGPRLPLAPPPDPETESATVLGIVVDAEPERGRVAARVDCGLDSPLGCSFDADTAPEPGDPLEVRLLRDGGAWTITSAQPLARQTRERRDGEVRTARVEPIGEFPGLRVQVDGEHSWAYPTDEDGAAVRGHWDPDLLRDFDRDAPGSWTTLVRWDNDSSVWLPVDRRYGEMIAREFGPTHEWPASVQMTFAEPVPPTRPGGETRWRLVPRPGLCYLMGRSDWDASSLRRIENEPDLPGKRVAVAVDRRTGRARLEPSGHRDDEAVYFDDRNRRWLDLEFPDLYLARREADDHWYLPVEGNADEGFPTKVRVQLENVQRLDECHCQVTSAWNEAAARRRSVTGRKLDPKGIKDPRSPSRERYEALTDDAPLREVTVTVPLKGRPRAAFVTGHLAGDRMNATVDMEVTVHADTLNLADIGKSVLSSFRQRRRALVVSDGPDRSAEPHWRPISRDELTEVLRVAPDGEGDDAALDGLERFEGCVVEPLRDGDDHYGAWLRLRPEGPPRYASIHKRFLGEGHKLGHPIEARRGQGEWEILARRRIITVRALFKEVDEPGEHWVAVGGAPGGSRELRQDPESPTVAWCAQESSETAPFADARLEKTGKPWRADAGGKTERFVHAKAREERHGREIMAPVSLSGYPRRPVVDRIELSEEHRTGERWVLLCPKIIAKAGGRPDGVRAPRESEAASLTKAWERALAFGDGHLLGSIDEQERVFTPETHLHMPLPEGGFGGALPLAAGIEPPVGGRESFLRRKVRVRAVRAGAGFRASLAVNPLSITDLVAEVTNDRRPTERRQGFGGARVLYVGPRNVEGREVHQFCWGLGWVADVPAERLFIGPRPITDDPTALFHGDQVLGAKFTWAGGSGELTMTVYQDDILHFVAGQAYEEATAHVVHQILVRPDHRGRTLRVLSVRLQNGHADKEGAVERRLPGRLRASIGPKTAAELLALHRRGEVGNGDDSPFWITAEADRSRIAKSRGRELVFEHVPPSRLETNHQLYLEVKGLRRTRNDLVLEFGMPDGLEADPKAPLRVGVSRRRYSHREDALRRELERRGDKDDCLNGVRMLVRLTKARGGNAWDGSTKSPPPRPLRTLRTYLRNQGSAPTAVIAPKSEIELRPGVVWRSNRIREAHKMPVGTVVRLLLDGSVIRAEQALPSEHDYLKAGRPVILLPTNLLLQKAPPTEERARSGFTVAGFAEAGVAIEQGALGLLRLAHPKLGSVRTRGDVGRQEILPTDEFDEAIAAKVSRDNRNREVLQVEPVRGASGGESELPQVAWAQLSFQEGSRIELWRRCLDATWRYHDLWTGHRTAGRDGGPVPHRLGSKLGMLDEPVFFHSSQDRLTLRYPRNRLARYGYSANELLADHRRQTAQWYTVVGPSKGPSESGGLWVELSPGRIVEIPGSLITAPGAGSRPLGAEFRWASFSTGDSVRLRVAAEPGGIGHIELLDWIAGRRGAMGGGSRRMLLDVVAVDREDGCLELGSGHGPIRYPVGPKAAERYAGESAVWLDQGNELVSGSASQPSQGDTVLLGLAEDGAFRVVGLPGATVTLSESGEESWPGTAWLRDALEDPGLRHTVIEGLGGALPMTVEAWDDTRMTLSRRFQPNGRWPGGTTEVGMIGEVKAHLDDGTVMVGRGSALHSMPVDGLVHGLSGDRVALVAGHLRHSGRVWWRNTGGHSVPGLAARPSGSGAEIEVEVVDGVDVKGQCVGLLCRDAATMALHWMPVGEASWIPGLPTARLREVLGAQRTVVLLEDGTVSILRRIDTERHFLDLRLGSQLSVTAHSAHRSGQWLARTEPFGVPVVFDAGRPAPAPGVQYTVEVSFHERISGTDAGGGVRRHVVMMRPGERTAPLDVPQWIRTAIAKPGDDRTRQVLEQRRTYGDWVDGVLTDEDRSDVTARLLCAAGRIASGGDHPDLAVLIREWMNGPGTAPFRLKAGTEADLAQMLAATIVCDEAEKDDPRLQGAAVVMAHLLGVAATRALHTVPLVVKWIARNDADPRGPHGLWSRLLETVPKTTGMTGANRAEIAACCHAILMRQAFVGKQASVAQVARSLMTSLGAPEDPLRLSEEDSSILRPLSVFARTLHPRSRPGGAAARLSPAQRELLRDQLGLVVGSPFITPAMRHLHQHPAFTGALLARFKVEEGEAEEERS